MERQDSCCGTSSCWIGRDHFRAAVFATFATLSTSQLAHAAFATFDEIVAQTSPYIYVGTGDANDGDAIHHSNGEIGANAAPVPSGNYAGFSDTFTSNLKVDGNIPRLAGNPTVTDPFFGTVVVAPRHQRSRQRRP